MVAKKPSTETGPDSASSSVRGCIDRAWDAFTAAVVRQIPLVKSENRADFALSGEKPIGTLREGPDRQDPPPSE